MHRPLLTTCTSTPLLPPWLSIADVTPPPTGLSVSTEDPNNPPKKEMLLTLGVMTSSFFQKSSDESLPHPLGDL